MERTAMTAELATLERVKPSLEHLPKYKAALVCGWSPDNVREAAAIREGPDEPISTTPHRMP
jgi:hypothetical protein